VTANTKGDRGRYANEPLVSIVLLAYNGKRYLDDCALSIARQDYHNIEIVVVNNGSTDGSVQTLRDTYPQWNYVVHENNLGFSAGMNSGLASARGDYLVFLNQDVYLDESFVSCGVRILESLPDAGALGALEYKWADGERTEHLRSTGPALFLRLRIQGVWLMTDSPVSRCFGVNGSFPLLRREALAELERLDGHCFDPAFFSGWEDQDLWWRMQLRGWSCYATQKTKAWHVGSGSAGEKESFLSKSPRYQRSILRNRWFVILKNIPLPLLIFVSPLLLTLEIGLPFYLLLRSPGTLASWVGGWQDVARSLGSIRAKRAAIQDTRKLPLRVVVRWFKGF